jgi:ABC-type antimicrobial peptide transport system permease subunit
MEMYESIRAREGTTQARIWLWRELLTSFPGFVNNTIYWSFAMFRNYVITALRNIRKFKGYALVNILGLSIGIASCLLASLWLAHEYSFDNFHDRADDLFQVLTQGDTVKDNPSTPAPLGAALESDFPDIEHVSRYGGLGELMFSHGDARFDEGGIRCVDSSFFQMFGFEFLQGNPTTVLADLHSIVITQDVAQKYFGNEEPIGKILTMDNDRDFTVTGVLAPIPSNSSISFDMAVRFEIREQRAVEETGDEMGWGWFEPQTFVQMRKGTPMDEFSEKAAGVIGRHADNEDAGISFLPLKERYQKFWNGIELAYLVLLVAVFVLLIASLNYINLETARSSNRAREVGMRKVVGAFRSSIVLQLLSESLALTLTALVVALVLASAALPLFNEISGMQLSWDSLPFASTALVSLGLLVIIGILAGSYPAFAISAFKPIVVVSGDLNRGQRGSKLRKVLVIAQFIVSILLIISAGVAYKQVSHMMNLNVGYQPQNIVNIPLKGSSASSYELLKDRLSHDSRILMISGSTAAFPYINWNTTTTQTDWSGKDEAAEPQEVYFNLVDHDLVETLQIEMVEGRSFSRDIAGDENAYLINEEMARVMGGNSIVGKYLSMWDERGPVIGVMKNFHYQPMTRPIKPLVLLLKPDRVNVLIARIQSEDVGSTIGLIEKSWGELLPNHIFEYQFLNENFASAYRQVDRIGNLVAGFAGLAVVLACMGLLSLAAYAVRARAKEIAIRKVLGAGIARVMAVLSKEVVICVLIANLIAWPLAYLLMNDWLENYAYRIKLGPSVFFISLLLTMVAALAAVSFQVVRAARANPVERLKHE